MYDYTVLQNIKILTWELSNKDFWCVDNVNPNGINPIRYPSVYFTSVWTSHTSIKALFYVYAPRGTFIAAVNPSM